MTALATEFAGRRGALFGLALKTSLLTVLTLGIYRFWMKTRLRRWYWSAIRPGGHPLEYLGQPIEKLLGFLIAVVILAFYLGVVNLALMFGSLALLNEVVWAYALSFIGIIPILFYAQYRARRYVLARTRWRGLRFGLDPGAWGYALRAMGHWALTLLTAGVLWPRMTFKLEKYRADRTWYGSQRLHQGGRWTMLYRAAWPLIIGLVLLAIAIGASAAGRPLIVVAIAAGFLIGYGIIYWRVETLRMLTETKTAGPIRLTFAPSPRRVLAVYGFGGTLAVIAILVVLLALYAAAFAALYTWLGGAVSIDDLLDGALFRENPELVRFAAGLGIMSYIAVFLAWGVLTHVLITFPIYRHYAQAFGIEGAEHLDEIRQRARDDAAQAEGFAEALDLGAAI